MITVCSWCQKTIGVDDQPPVEVVTHGICVSCAHRYFTAAHSIPLFEYIDQLAQPILLIDKDRLVHFANRAAQQMTGKSQSQIVGKLGGDVIECIHAATEAGCGRTVHCDGCQIRICVNATFERKVGRRNVEAYRDLMTPTGVERKRFMISTEYLDGLVMLRVDRVDAV